MTMSLEANGTTIPTTEPNSTSTNSTPAIGLIYTSTEKSLNALSNADIESYLQQRSDAFAMNHLPSLIIISLMSIIGTFNNSIVIYVYLTKFKPASTRSAILALACYDFVVSCFFMPGEVLILRFSYNFPSPVLCKCIRTIGSISILGSFMAITVVTYDRYRRICRPADTQLTVRGARKMLLACFLMAVVCSIPQLFVYGINDAGLANARSCNIDKEYDKNFLPTLNITIHIVIFIGGFFTVIVVYCLIGRVVIKQKRRWRTLRQIVAETQTQSATIGIVNGQQAGTEDPGWSLSVSVSGSAETPDDQITDNSETPVTVTFSDVAPDESSNPIEDKERPNKKESKLTTISTTINRSMLQTYSKYFHLDASTRKTTLTLFIISIVFILSFLPYLILNGLLISGVISLNWLNTFLFPLYIRSFFLSNVTNCFVYAFSFPKFRRETKRAMFKLFPCCRTKRNQSIFGGIKGVGAVQ